MRPLRSDFDGAPFGANVHGALAATAEGHLLAMESGAMLNLAEVARHGLTKAESKELEQVTRAKAAACKPSALSGCPRGRGDEEELWQSGSLQVQ